MTLDSFDLWFKWTFHTGRLLPMPFRQEMEWKPSTQPRRENLSLHKLHNFWSSLNLSKINTQIHWKDIDIICIFRDISQVMNISTMDLFNRHQLCGHGTARALPHRCTADTHLRCSSIQKPWSHIPPKVKLHVPGDLWTRFGYQSRYLSLACPSAAWNTASLSWHLRWSQRNLHSVLIGAYNTHTHEELRVTAQIH